MDISADRDIYLMTSLCLFRRDKNSATKIMHLPASRGCCRPVLTHSTPSCPLELTLLHCVGATASPFLAASAALHCSFRLAVCSYPGLMTAILILRFTCCQTPQFTHTPTCCLPAVKTQRQQQSSSLPLYIHLETSLCMVDLPASLS